MVDESSLSREMARVSAAEPMGLRLRKVQQWLLDGVSRTEAVAAAQQQWQLGRRMAQQYVRRAQQRLADEAASEDRLYYLRLSQLQRDRILQMLLQVLPRAMDVTPDQLRALASLVAASCRLLDSRDRTAECIAAANEPARMDEHERKQLLARLEAEVKEMERRDREFRKNAPRLRAEAEAWQPPAEFLAKLAARRAQEKGRSNTKPQSRPDSSPEKAREAPQLKNSKGSDGELPAARSPLAPSSKGDSSPPRSAPPGLVQEANKPQVAIK